LAGIIFSRKNIALLLVIASIGIALSLVSFRYSAFTAEEIARIASVDVKSNAQIEAHDLSQTLLHTLESLTNNLKALANSQPVQKGDVLAGQSLLKNTQGSTSKLTEGYYWLDKDGELVAWSPLNASEIERYKGLNLNEREFYTIPQRTLVPYYSNAIESPDNVPRLYISYPILTPAEDQNNVAENRSSFNGVVVAVVDVDSLGKFLQDEISPEFMSNVGLMDKNGIILYARNQSLVGKNYESSEFQATVPDEVKSEYMGILSRSLEANPGAEDITYNGTTTTISFQPINVEGNHIWTLFLGSPHNLATDVGIIIDQQNNLSSQIVIIIALIAVGIAVLILSWNKRLEKAVRDRTLELKAANESLSKANRLLEGTNEQLLTHDRMQKEFINIAARELRTPILPILTEAEFLSRKFQPHKNRIQIEEEQIRSIILNAKRLDRLASDILDVTRIESRTLNLNMEKFDIDDLIRHAIREANERLLFEEEKKIELLYEAFHCTIYADKGRLFQVIMNLIDNAIKFTDRGKVSITVTRIAKEIEVEVKDTGSGINGQIMPKLFSKFATTSENGTGLGLFISKNIIEAHGGIIWAENNTVEGATFKFRVPID
jgi:signal transduction histidine kinase/uncharacterized protein YcfL